MSITTELVDDPENRTLTYIYNFPMDWSRDINEIAQIKDYMDYIKEADIGFNYRLLKVNDPTKSFYRLIYLYDLKRLRDLKAMNENDLRTDIIFILNELMTLAPHLLKNVYINGDKQITRTATI
jgi:hypothetical protein